jgi:photosystem II stability/assembly factor-like uncharacterized protein
MKSSCHCFILTCCFVCMAACSLMAGPLWTLTTAPYSSWVAVASSADGNTLAVAADGGLIYVSTNSGAAWTAATNAPSGYWMCITVSADGSHMTAALDGGSIYTSQDYGATWAYTGAPDNYWWSMACSADGRSLAAAALCNGWDNTAPGHIYTSSDSGATWTPALDLGFWVSVASSSDGSSLVAVDSQGLIYLSTNGGAAWLPTTAPAQNCCSVASSADGNRLVVVANRGPVYTSTNAGGTWTLSTTAPSAGWVSVSSSADGSKLAAAQFGGQIYTSADAGTTWVPNSVPDTLQAIGMWGVAVSSDGNRVLAAGDGPSGGPVYLLQPLPSLKIEHRGLDVLVSWASSATGFTLQQNADLSAASWTSAIVVPLPTNGQNQVIIPQAEGKYFYRLAFPTGTPRGGWPFPPPSIGD